MTIQLEFGASTLEWDKSGLTVHISRQQFTPKHWLSLGEQLSHVQGKKQWLSLPFQVGEGKDARWKKPHLDLFSLVVYLLLLSPRHKLKRLLQSIDWGEIDRRCGELYENKERGSRAYAPQILYRMLLLVVVYGLRFESSLLEQMESNLAWRWFCGFGVLTPLPTAATLCYFRQRLGPQKFEEILGWLIQECEQAGLVDLEEAYFDFTGVTAGATPLTTYQRVLVMAQALSAYVAGLDTPSMAESDLKAALRPLIIAAAQTVMSEPHPSVAKLKATQLANSLTQLEAKVAAMPRGPGWWQRICQTLASWRQQKPEWQTKGRALLQQLLKATPGSLMYEQSCKDLVSHLEQVGQKLRPVIPHAWGDLAARVGVLRANQTLCGYLAGYLVDKAHNIIIGLLTVPANAAQSSSLKTVLEKSKSVLGRLPQRLGLDSAFDHDHVYTDLAAESIDLYIVSRNRRSPKDCFGPEHFCFVDDDANQLHCPADKLMQLKYGPYKNGRAIYWGVDCSTCPLLAQCVPKGHSERRFNIDVESHRRWQQNRSQNQGATAQHILRQRFAREGVFGHANTYHNGDRLSYRSPGMPTVADCLTVFVMNLEKLADHQLVPP